MTTKLIPAELAPIVQNTYWRERDAALILAAWAQSGRTLSAFARQCGLSVSRLRRWKRRLESDDSPRFHPVELVETPTRRSSASDPPGAGIEVIVDSGRRIVVHPGFDRTLLLEVIETLESC